MTDLILILSQCINRSKRVKHNEFYYRFHFKGYYLGYKVQEVLIKSLNDREFEIGEEYLLWVRRQSIESGILKVEPIKYKKIGE